MSIIKINELQPTTGTTVTFTGNTTTTGTSSVSGDVTVTGVISGSSYIGDGSNLSGTGVNIQEQDGSPAIANATTLKFSNSSVTDEGGGVVSVTITTSGSWFRPSSTSVDTGQNPATEMSTDTQLTASVTGSLYTPSTTFSSSNPAVISVVSQTYVANNRMTVVLSSSAVTASSITLYAYNGAQQDDTPTTVTTGQPPVVLVPVNPPLLYFDFEEGAGAYLGNKSNTTYVSNAESASAITGAMGGTFENSTAVRGTWCGSFDGSGQKIVLPEYPNYNMLDMLDTGVSGAFTFSCWVNSTSGHDYDFAVGYLLRMRAPGWYERGYGLAFRNNGKQISGGKYPDTTGPDYGTWDGIYWDPGPNTAMSVDTWYHIVFTCDTSNNQFLYFNGSVIGNDSRGTAGTILYNNTIGNVYGYEKRFICGGYYYFDYLYGFHAGSNAGSNDYHYNGLIDEVALFDYFMTPEQVNWMYNSGSNPPSLADGVPVLP